MRIPGLALIYQLSPRSAWVLGDKRDGSILTLVLTKLSVLQFEGWQGLSPVPHGAEEPGSVQLQDLHMPKVPASGVVLQGALPSWRDGDPQTALLGQKTTLPVKQWPEIWEFWSQYLTAAGSLCDLGHVVWPLFCKMGLMPCLGLEDYENNCCSYGGFMFNFTNFPVRAVFGSAGHFARAGTSKVSPSVVFAPL